MCGSCMPLEGVDVLSQKTAGVTAKGGNDNAYTR
jgi:hypothetical protein